MTQVAIFDVLGVPKGQPRARACIRGQRAGVYDPGTAAAWKANVLYAARPFIPATPLDCPIRLMVSLYFPRPARLTRKSSPEGAIPYTSKPDADNALKAIMDALTDAGMWRDDALIYSATVEKFYASKDESPGAIIRIFKADD